MYEAGVDLVVTPYRGRPVESPWWRVAPNPTYREGESYQAVRDVLARAEGRPLPAPGRVEPRGVELRPAHAGDDPALASPRAGSGTSSGSSSASSPDAVVVFTVPMAHLRGHPDGAPRALRDPGRVLRRRRPDEPARVRRHGHGLQPVPRRGSVGVRPRALELRGRDRAAARARARAGPRRSSGPRIRSSSRRSRSRRRSTSSSTATATSSAATGCRRWSASRRGSRPSSTSRSAGSTSRATPARARLLGDIPFNVFARAISAARVNLNITRRPHATVPARPPRGRSSSPPRARRSCRTRTRASSAGSSRVASSSSSRARRRRSRPTGSSSPIPRRRRRWDVARASASSTSTRTPIAPVACSSSSASESRRLA